MQHISTAEASHTSGAVLLSSNYSTVYKSSYYNEPNEAAMVHTMEQYPFAIITGMGSSFPEATHVPVEIEKRDGKLFLKGHLMKNTSHHKALAANPQVLAIFNGPHCYISASWYADGKHASTWNYITVHAKGIMHFGDEQQTLQAIKSITEKYEGHHNAASFHQLSDEYIAQNLKGIVSFEVEVQELSSVFKLSQNRDTQSKHNIITALRQRNGMHDKDIADEIEKRL